MQEEKKNKRKYGAPDEELETFLRFNPFLYPFPFDKYPDSAGHPLYAADCPLHAAAHHDRDDLVSYLVQEKGVKVDDRIHFNETPLIRAVRQRCLSAARLLLELGADISLRDANGRNALWFAVINKDYPMMRMLVEHGGTCTRDDFGVSTNWSEILADDFVQDLLMEKLFSMIVVGGICSKGQFRDFLAEGVCDARLLIHIASFAVGTSHCSQENT